MILTNDGYVYVWGLNENGELGTGTYNKVKEPTLLNYVSDVTLHLVKIIHYY